MSIPNTTFRSLVEKLGGTAPTDYIGNLGDLFYDPNSATLRISDGSTPGGVIVINDSETRAYVDTEVAAAVAALVDSAPGTLDTLNELAASINDDNAVFTTLTNSIAAVQADVDQNESDADAALALKAPLDGPVFTGVPAGPTAAQGTNTGQLATTAFVAAEIAVVQADVDQNEIDSDAADLALSNRLDVLEADPATFSQVTAVQTAAATARTNLQTALQNAINAVQSDVDQNEADADAAITAAQTTLQANIDAEASARATAITNLVNGADAALDTLKEIGDALSAGDTSVTNALTAQITTEATTRAAALTQEATDRAAAITAAQTTLQNAINVVQADVDQNESDADTAIAAEATARAAAITALQADVDQNEADADAAINLRALAADSILTGITEAKGKLHVGNDGLNSGYYLKFQRNGNTQFDILGRNVPSGGNLNISNSNGNNARVVVYSDEFWVRNLGGNNGNGKAKFDGEVTFNDSFLLDGTKVTATGDELNHVDGVTSNIQTQLDAKLSAETITLTAFKAVVAASSDFADFQSRVAAL